MILLVVIFILMMQFLWVYIDELVGKGLSLGIVAEFLFWGSCTVLALALPLIAFVYGNYGFDTLFWMMAGAASLIFVAVACLPAKLPAPAAVAAAA